MTTEEAIDTFLLTGRASGWSRATVRQYSFHLHKVAATIPADPNAITKAHLRQWAASIRDTWQPATCRTNMIALRSFLRFLFDEGIVDVDLSTVLKVPKVPPRVQRTASMEEVTAILDACATPPSAGLTSAQAIATSTRNRALICLMFDAIPRASEVCRLDLTDIDVDAGLVTIHGKGGKVATVGFSPASTYLLTQWLNYRPTVATDPAALFVAITGANPGARLTTNGLRTIMRKLAVKAGIPHLSPHAMRRGGTVQALMNGAPTEVVKLHGRWEKLEMVETYARNLHAIKEMRKYSPMNGHREEPEA